MKLTKSILTCLAAAHAICAQQPTAENVRAVEGTLKQIEHASADALVKGDVATWSRCVADDWIGTTPEGNIVTKPGAYADLKAGLVVRDLFRLDDLKVRVYGDMAIVLGLDPEQS